MRKLTVSPFLLILSILLLAPIHRGWAGTRTYFDAAGNPISAETYQEMRQRRQTCLETTSDQSEFTRCMERRPTALPAESPAARSPVPRPVSPPPPPRKAPEIPVSPGMEQPRAPAKMDNPVIPGQREQPVRVIEREISVPGSGVLKVKEYQYE